MHDTSDMSKAHAYTHVCAAVPDQPCISAAWLFLPKTGSDPDSDPD